MRRGGARTAGLRDRILLYDLGDTEVPTDERVLLDGRLRVLTGDITRIEVDAVVNAANGTLLGGGGVDGAIHRAGGPAILAECREIRRTRYPDGMPTGKAVATTGGRLPARHVIHTVGPVWQDGKSGEPDLLASAYRESLELAAQIGARTAAFPAISTGVYGYPKTEAARVAIAAIREHLEGHPLPRTVILVFFSGPDAEVFLDAVDSS